MKWLLKILTVMLLLPAFLLAQQYTFCPTQGNCNFTGPIIIQNMTACTGTACGGGTGLCPFVYGVPFSIDCPPAVGTAYDQEFGGTFTINTVPPGWTIVNQGGATVQVVNGLLEIYETSSGTESHRLVVESLSGTTTPWTFTAKLKYTGVDCTFFTAGIAIRDSASGKFISYHDVGGTDHIIADRYNSPTSFNSTVTGTTGPYKIWGNWIYVQIQNTGTAYNFNWSMDGITFANAQTETVGSFLTADQIGLEFGALNSCSAANAVVIGSFDWIRKTQ